MIMACHTYVNRAPRYSRMILNENHKKLSLGHNGITGTFQNDRPFLKITHIAGPLLVDVENRLREARHMILNLC